MCGCVHWRGILLSTLCRGCTTCNASMFYVRIKHPRLFDSKKRPVYIQHLPQQAVTAVHYFHMPTKKANTKHVSREIHSKSRSRCCDWAPLRGLACCKRRERNRQPGRNRALDRKMPGGGFPGRSTPFLAPNVAATSPCSQARDRRFCNAFENFACPGLGFANARVLCSRERVFSIEIWRTCNSHGWDVAVGCPFACAIPRSSSTSEARRKQPSAAARGSPSRGFQLQSRSLPVVTHLAVLTPASQPAARCSRHSALLYVRLLPSMRCIAVTRCFMQ
jgi:hypothetical protein